MCAVYCMSIIKLFFKVLTLVELVFYWGGGVMTINLDFACVYVGVYVSDVEKSFKEK